MPTQPSDNFESFKVKGEDLLKEIKKLFHEGNVRKIVIKDEKGKVTYIEIPLTIGVIGTILLPALAAVGALAAMVGLVTVEVVKEADGKAQKKGKVARKAPVKAKGVKKNSKARK